MTQQMQTPTATEPFVIPASPAQRRLWFVDRLVPGHAFYSIHTMAPLGAVSPKLVQAALDQVARRHESLRTTFSEVDGEPVQVIHPAARIRVRLVDLMSLAPEHRNAAALQMASVEATRPFDLVRGPLLRVVLVRLDNERHQLLVTIHHIISDGWSMSVLFSDFTAWYEALATGQASPLPPLEIQYADYAAWQVEQLESMGPEHLAYWRHRLEDAPTLELATDHPRPALPSFSGAACDFNLPRSLVRKIEKVGRSENATLFVTLLGGFFLMLRDYVGQNDLVVGAPISGRNRSELEPLIGFFVNMLVIRSTIDEDDSFRTMLGRLRSDVLDAFAHQEVPFDRIVEELHRSRDLSRHPIFQIAFQLHQRPDMTDASIAGSAASAAHMPKTSSNFDLHIELWPDAAGLAGRINFATDLFDEPTIRLQAAHFRRVLERVAEEPDAPLTDLRLLGDQEQSQLLAWGLGSGQHRADTTVHGLVEQQVDRSAGSVAIRAGGDRISMAKLDERANAVANALLERGLRAQEPVGVVGDRSIHLVPALLGVLKAGGAYVGIDPGEPPARMAELLRRAGCRYLLAEQVRAEELAGDGLTDETVQILHLDGPTTFHAGHAVSRPAVDVSPDDAAYISFTSGSTGHPKGVAVTHRGVARLVTATSFHEISSSETFLLLSTLAFDASTMEIWGPLTNGATLVVHPPGPIALSTLADVIRGSQVTTLFLTAGLFHQFVDEELEALAGVTTLISGGDVLSADHIRRVLDLPGRRVMINAYGPTENASYTTCHVMTNAAEVPARVPIGRPISGTTVHVLDDALKPVPIGAPGDLWTGGLGLAQGYIGDAEATAAAFLDGPFEHVPDERLYRTGDRARWRSDGTLDFLGRADRQVKIRGFRVEPGEVEAALTSIAKVRDAAVLVDGDDSDDRRLVAFVIPVDDDSSPTVDEIRAHLAKNLPRYLVPSIIRRVQHFPLTHSGKLDRRELLLGLDQAGAMSGENVLPRTPVEAALAPIWSQVLGLEDVSVTADFFSDLGGHSLLGTRLVARARDAFDVDLPLRTLFETPDVAGMAAAIESLLLDELRLDDTNSVPVEQGARS